MLALDGANNLFINDSSNYRVRVVAYPSGIIDTVAGNGQAGNTGDGGPARTASFSSPTGVSIDPDGRHLFISAKDDLRVRIVSFGGVVVPSLTPTFTSIPPTLTFTPTFTPIPATATFTSIPPTATFTSIPPTATFTSVPPTATRTQTPASTSTRTATSTRTGTATRTNTPAPSDGSVSGRIRYYSNGSAVSNVRVDFSGPAAFSAMTNSTGGYVANSIELGGWSIDPMRSGGVGNSVSSLDAARVLQSIAGLIGFTPMQRLACDVTGDGNLSALDAVRILQYSAGVIQDLPLASTCGSDWIFYPSPDPFQFQQITTPLMGLGSCQPGDIFLSLTSALNTATNQDFDAMVIGDCTGNWTPSSGAFRLAASAGATVHAGALRSGRGRTYQLPLYVQSTAPFNALDVKLAYDPAVVTLRAVRPRGAASDALIGVHDDGGGVATVTLANAGDIDGSTGPVLVVELSSKAANASGVVQLLSAQVDEQTARVVTRTRR
jgi:hypothetical protein